MRRGELSCPSEPCPSSLCFTYCIFFLLTMKFKQILMRLRVRKATGTMVVVKNKARSICSFLFHMKSEGMFDYAVVGGDTVRAS